MNRILLTKKDVSQKIGKYTIYNCPVCDKNHILNIHHYCPMCGISIAIEGE